MSHTDYKFSVTIRTDDQAVVGCLRSLAKFSQKSGNNNIPWGGTKDRDWRRADNHVTFHFSTAPYRDALVQEAERLLPSGLLEVVSKSDSDAARPQ